MDKGLTGDPQACYASVAAVSQDPVATQGAEIPA